MPSSAICATEVPVSRIRVAARRYASTRNDCTSSSSKMSANNRTAQRRLRVLRLAIPPAMIRPCAPSISARGNPWFPRVPPSASTVGTGTGMSMSGVNVTICLPTYNERENLEPMLRALGDVLPDEGRVLVVDDSSPDGTGQLADELSATLGYVDVLHRPRKEGLGRAYLAAFERALRRWRRAGPRDGLRLLARPARRSTAARDRRERRPRARPRYVEGGRVENWGRCATSCRPAARSTPECCSASASATSRAASSAIAALCWRRSTSTP